MIMTLLSISLPASDEFCRLLMIFANSLDPDQARSESKLSDTLMLSLKEYFEKSNDEKYLQKSEKNNEKKYPACKELKVH